MPASGIRLKKKFYPALTGHTLYVHRAQLFYYDNSLYPKKGLWMVKFELCSKKNHANLNRKICEKLNNCHFQSISYTLKLRKRGRTNLNNVIKSNLK